MTKWTMKTPTPTPLKEGVSRYDGHAFRTFTIDDLGTINDMFEDKTGTLWFATWEGVNRYDGEKFSSIISQRTDRDRGPTALVE